MNQNLATKAELMKLARLLELETAELEYLQRLAVTDLRALREQVTQSLFELRGGMLGRIAAASRLLPTGVIAVIAERAYGPMMAARIAGRLEPERAAEVAGRLPTDFLADVAVELDPRRVSALLARIPAAQIGQVAGELSRRGEYVTLGRFVGHLPPEALRAAVSEMDDHTMLQVMFVLEEMTSLEPMLRLIGEQRGRRVLATADSEQRVDVAELLEEVSEPIRSQLASSLA